MLSVIVCVCVAVVTTLGCHVWHERQLKAAGAAYQDIGWAHKALIVMELLWIVMMTLLIWMGFVDKVGPEAYSFRRLGLSLLLGGGFVVVGMLGATAMVRLGSAEGAIRYPLWRRIHPHAFQLLFLLFSGAAFQHSGWDGAP